MKFVIYVIFPSKIVYWIISLPIIIGFGPEVFGSTSYCCDTVFCLIISLRTCRLSGWWYPCVIILVHLEWNCCNLLILFGQIGMIWRLYRSILEISESYSISISFALMICFPRSSPFIIFHAVFDFCILSPIALFMFFVEPIMCPITLAFVSNFILQNGLGGFAICCLYLFFTFVHY